MKFILESVAKCSGRSRIGSLVNVERLPGKSFETPMALINNPQLSREVNFLNQPQRIYIEIIF